MKKDTDSVLSKRELDVMNVLWEAKKPLIASDIPKARPDLSINTVQAVMKKLIAKNFIKVDDIVHSGTVLTRSYVPTIAPEDYALHYVKSEIFPFGKFLSKAKLINTLFESSENEDGLIEELEGLIQEKKNAKK